MVDRHTIVAFQQGLEILQQVRDFASLADTINRMISIVPAEDLRYAYDSIARVMRTKQAIELQEVGNHPEAIMGLDKKYQDLYIVLRSARPRPPTPQAPPTPSAPPAPPAVPAASTLGATPPTTNTPANDTNNQLANSVAQGNPLGGAVLNWVKSNKGVILASTAVASTLGGGFWLYKYLTTEPIKRSEDNSFDKTIKSIQKYKAFSQMMKNPDLGNVEEFLMGKTRVVVPNKKKKPEKKEEPVVEKTSEWDTEERSLMKDLDGAFNALSFRPNLEFTLPQLPAPKAIDPSEVVDTKVAETPEKKEKKKELRPARMTESPRKKTESPKLPSLKTDKVPETPKNPVNIENSGGRLIPIIKRTKRVKKITA
jgi:hypothetical protein